MQYDLTKGDITKNLLKFALPLMAGNVLQQLYNVADTFIVGKFIGADALAAVGSSYTLMVFLTSILLGLCMGSSAFFSVQFGKKDFDRLKKGFFISFIFIGAVTVLINFLAFLCIKEIISMLKVPFDIVELMYDYLNIIFWGIAATFVYNYFANLLRSVGNSVVPLIFLAVSAVMNIALDLIFVIAFNWGVSGAAAATVFSQYASAIGIFIYFMVKFSDLRVKKCHMVWDKTILKDITELSLLTCIQQSVMNLGILMVQGLVNSFGKVVMAAFAAAVKIDSFAYMPVQDFGNAFSTFIAQNYGAGEDSRIKKGIKSAALVSLVFCVAVSLLVCIFAKPLMEIFIEAERTDIVNVGIIYLRIEASFYFAIGMLFLLYGFYRAVNKPVMSVILTFISLGTRVVLAHILSSFPTLGTTGIWMSVPIGWILADTAGILYYIIFREKLLKVNRS